MKILRDWQKPEKQFLASQGLALQIMLLTDEFQPRVVQIGLVGEKFVVYFFTVETKVLTYRTIIEKDGKYYHGYVLALPGCHTQGDTIEETLKNLKEAMEGWLEARRDLGWDIPQDEIIETLQTVVLPIHPKQAYA